MAKRWGKNGNRDFILWGSKITADGDCSHEIKRTCSLEGKLWQIWQYMIKQRHHFADKGPYSQSYSFPALMYGCKLDHIQGWTPRNWYFRIVMLDKTLESPLDCKEIQPVNPKVNQPWIFIGRTDTEAEAPILWPPDAIRATAVEKTLMLGKTEGKRRRRRGQRMQ